MKRPFITILTLLAVLGSVCKSAWAAKADRESEFDLDIVLELKLGEPVGQCRAVPVTLGDKRAIFLAHCEDVEIDPYVEMFFFPKHSMKLVVLALDGTVIWKKELGPGVIPGIWFLPFFPFDLNGDGIHELVRGLAEGDGAVLDHTGQPIGQFGGHIAMASKFLDRPASKSCAATPTARSASGPTATPRTPPPPKPATPTRSTTPTRALRPPATTCSTWPAYE